MKQNIRTFLSIYLINLNYFKFIVLLRIFPLLMLFNILSCESSKNFNIFSSQEIPEKVVKDKDYIYGEHYAPHDIEVMEFSTGKTRTEVAYQLGIRFRILPKLNLEDGIHSLKMVLPRCWFNVENTKPLIDALRQYHRKYNEKMKMFSNKPVRDWSSHACDSARYMAMSINDLPNKQRPNQKTTENEYAIHGE